MDSTPQQKLRNERARFGLSGAADLVEKLHYDLQRLEVCGKETRRRASVFTAMDCAATIVALKDWINDERADRGLPALPLETSIPHFQVARELANGFKHRTVDRHNPKVRGFASGHVHLQSPNGEHVQFAWCGYDSETFTLLPLFREIATHLEKIISAGQ